MEFKSSLPLFPFQKTGVEFLLKVGSGLLCDSMGLGKTIQSLAVCEHIQAKKVLILTPSAVKWQWHDEIKKFIGKEAMVVEGTPKERERLWYKVDLLGNVYFIANYEQLLRDFKYMDRWHWDVIIADEVTKVSNPRTK